MDTEKAIERRAIAKTTEPLDVYSFAFAAFEVRVLVLRKAVMLVMIAFTFTGRAIGHRMRVRAVPQRAWNACETPYYIDSDTAFTPLLRDASNFLQGAHGSIIRCLSDALKSPDIEPVDTFDLSSALAGVAILIKMGHACVGKAYLCILMQQMGADESTH